tara:strand:+ start:1001 stop:1147 length:147 start_codon:yes stop_codon:yes gene_type:complete
VLIVFLDENCWIKEIWGLSKEGVIQMRTKAGIIDFKKAAKNRAKKVYP